MQADNDCSAADSALTQQAYNYKTLGTSFAFPKTRIKMLSFKMLLEGKAIFAWRKQPFMFARIVGRLSQYQQLSKSKCWPTA